MTDLFYDSAALMIKAALLGVVLGAVYDVFRIIRLSFSSKTPRGAFFERIKPKKPLFCFPKRKKAGKSGKKAIVFIEDVLFFALCAVAEILFFIGLNSGEIRIYCLILSLAGFILYHLTLGKAVIYFSSTIIFFAKCLLYWIFYIIIIPVKYFIGLLKKAARAVYTLTVGKAADVVRRRRSRSLEKAFLSDAAACFGIFEEV